MDWSDLKRARETLYWCLCELESVQVNGCVFVCVCVDLYNSSCKNRERGNKEEQSVTFNLFDSVEVF